MLPLTLEDLLPLEEYAGRRREFFESHRRYLDRYRRVRIGPRLTLIFENRQTLWYRVQEIVRIARLADGARLQQELDLYNTLLPGRDQLQAALLIEVENNGLVQELATWQSLQGDHLHLQVGDQLVPATLLTCRPEDRCAGAAHWVQFTIPPPVRPLLADLQLAVFFRFDDGNYQHQTPPLSDDVRQSLLDDLALSERDAPTSRERRRAGPDEGNQEAR
jgi:hypothetical protein